MDEMRVVRSGRLQFPGTHSSFHILFSTLTPYPRGTDIPEPALFGLMQKRKGGRQTVSSKPGVGNGGTTAKKGICILRKAEEGKASKQVDLSRLRWWLGVPPLEEDGGPP